MNPTITSSRSSLLPGTMQDVTRNISMRLHQVVQIVDRLINEITSAHGSHPQIAQLKNFVQMATRQMEKNKEMNSQQKLEQMNRIVGVLGSTTPHNAGEQLQKLEGQIGKFFSSFGEKENKRKYSNYSASGVPQGRESIQRNLPSTPTNKQMFTKQQQSNIEYSEDSCQSFARTSTFPDQRKQTNKNTYYEGSSQSIKGNNKTKEYLIQGGLVEDDITEDTISNHCQEIISKYGVRDNKGRKERKRRRRQLDRNSDNDAPFRRKIDRHLDIELEQNIADRINSRLLSHEQLSKLRQSVRAEPSFFQTNQNVKSGDSLIHNVQRGTAGSTTSVVDMLTSVNNQNHNGDSPPTRKVLGKQRASYGMSDGAQLNPGSRQSNDFSRNNIPKKKGVHSFANSPQRNQQRRAYKKRNNEEQSQSSSFLSLSEDHEDDPSGIYSFRNTKSSKHSMIQTPNRSSAKSPDYGSKQQSKNSSKYLFDLNQSLSPENIYRSEWSEMTKKSKEQNPDFGRMKKQYPDYRISLSQGKIKTLLDKIKNRILLSCAVIDKVSLQVDKQATNQQQIDSRYQKEMNQRKNLIQQIEGKQQWKHPGVNIYHSPDKGKGVQIWQRIRMARQNL